MELLPCPFCGGEAKYHGSEDMVRIECKACGANPSGWWDETEDAVKEWNQRAPGWIGVENELPKDRVLCVAGEALMIGEIIPQKTPDRGYWARSEGEYLHGVTHWMKLPPLPNSEVANAR